MSCYESDDSNKAQGLFSESGHKVGKSETRKSSSKDKRKAEKVRHRSFVATGFKPSDPNLMVVAGVPEVEAPFIKERIKTKPKPTLDEATRKRLRARARRQRCRERRNQK